MVFKALVCLALFCATDLLKTLAAKSLARTFHKEAHFAKMQDALEKVLGPWPRVRMQKYTPLRHDDHQQSLTRSDA